jgi:hypothetical protein
MNRHHSAPSSADVAGELLGLAAGGGILTTVLAPFALPGLLLVVVPLAVLGVAAAVLVAPVVLIVWLARRARTTLRVHRYRVRAQEEPGPALARPAS